jgi:small subunit ribosomal protein S4
VTKRTAAKYKLDRRMGENIWGRPKSPVNRREYGPGQHGQRRKSKLSDFGTQLRAKQKLKGYYGDLTEKQFRRIYAEAVRVTGDTGENLIGLLERRLDAVVYRAKFVPTVFAARQFVNHGHVRVNGQKVNIPSYRVKEGDVIEVRDRSKQMALILPRSRRQPGTRRAGISERRPFQDDGRIRPHTGPVGCSLSRDDGTEPGGRILRQELSPSGHWGPAGSPQSFKAVPFGAAFCFERFRKPPAISPRQVQ